MENNEKIDLNSQLDIEKFKESCLIANDENINYLKAIQFYLFDAKKELSESLIDNPDNEILKCITGGLSFNDFKTKIKDYSSGNRCGLVLSEQDFGYLCETCSKEAELFFCLDCFKNGSHDGHKYSLLKCNVNGSCDCGSDIVSDKYSCTKHATSDSSNQLPDSLIKCAEYTLPHLMYRLLQYLRTAKEIDKKATRQTVEYPSDYYYNEFYSLISHISFIREYFRLLSELSYLNDTYRRLIVEFLLNENFYTQKISEEDDNDAITETKKDKTQNDDTKNDEKNRFKFINFLERALKNEKIIDYPDEFEKKDFIKFKFSCMLDEFIYWLVYFNSSDELNSLFLSLICDLNFLYKLMDSFLRYYCIIDLLVAMQNMYDSGQSYPRLLRFCSPLFSSKQLCLNAYEKSYLFETLLTSFDQMFKTADFLKPNELQTNSATKHMVVSCEHRCVSSKYFVIFLSNIRNILHFKELACIFLSNKNYFSMWLKFLLHIQGMNYNKRYDSDYYDYDCKSYSYAFDFEEKQCLPVMWSLAINGTNNSEITKAVLNSTYESLVKWFELIELKGGITPNKDHLVFHLPLHRLYSVFLYDAIFKRNFKLNDVLPTDKTSLLDLIAHPLQLQIVLNETLIRSTSYSSIRDEFNRYTNVNFSKSFIDTDRFLIQAILCNLDPDVFMKIFLERSRTIGICKKLINFENTEEEISIINGTLLLIAQLIEREIYLDFYNHDSIKNEIVQLLSINDRSFSEIEDAVSGFDEWRLDDNILEEFLNEIADCIKPNYKSSIVFKNAKYVLKPEYWENCYDPLYHRLYKSTPEDYEKSLDRYVECIKKKCKLDKVWPPFRLPKHQNNEFKNRLKILNTKEFHSVLFILLYRRFSETNPIDEKLFQLVIYLLELAVDAISDPDISKDIKDGDDVDDDTTAKNDIRYSESNLQNWFSSNNILDNLCETIPFIKLNSNNDDTENKSEQNEAEEKPETDQAQIEIEQVKQSEIQEDQVKKSEIQDDQVVPLETKVDQPENQAPIDHAEKSGENKDTEEVKVSADTDGKIDDLIEEPKDEAKDLKIINESMISMLLKILDKITLECDEKVENNDDSSREKRKRFRVQNKVNSSRIGDDYYFISNLLNKIASLSSKCKEKITQTISASDVSSHNSQAEISDDSDEETKKKKEAAKERQKRLLAKMAKKQQDFMNNVKNDKTLKRQVSQISVDEDVDDEQYVYDCCICRSAANASLDRPLGLISRIKTSNMLGLYTTSNTINSFDSLAANVSNENLRWFKEQKRGQLLREIFTTESCKHSVNIGYKCNAFIQSCGHYIHFDCYKEFAVDNEDSTKSFICPLCRQTSNCILPLKSNLMSRCKLMRLQSKSFTKETLSDELSHDSTEFILHMIKSESILDPKYLRTMMFCDNDVLTLLSQTVPVKYRHLEDTSEAKLNVPLYLMNPTDAILFLNSLLRTHLELSCLQFKNHKNTEVIRKCFMAFYDVLATRSRLLCIDNKSHIKAWNMLTKPTEIEQTTAKKDVVLLLRDPITVLILVILNWPFEIYRNTYQRIVNSVFNLVLVQNILGCIYKTDKESDSQAAVQQNGFHSLQDYISYIYIKLSKSSFKDTIKFITEANCENDIETLCLTFLRVSALLQSFIFEDEPDEKNTFESLISYLQIHYNKHPDANNKEGLLNWFETNPQEILDSWFDHLIDAHHSNRTNVESLISDLKIVYQPPSLIQLPYLYADLLFKYSSAQCKNCSNRNLTRKCVCLICGTFIINCCEDTNLKHMDDCSIDNCAFICINTTDLVIYRKDFAAKWSSLYLNKHGEDDIELKHGRNLYLCEDRYEIVKKLWSEANFDRVEVEWTSNYYVL